MKRKDFVFYVLVVLTLVGLFYISSIWKNHNQGNQNSDTVECIATRSTLYVSTGCSACASQKQILGDDSEKFNIVDCAVESEKCAGIITRVPTWEINGQQHIGVRSIEQLKTLTGC